MKRAGKNPLIIEKDYEGTGQMAKSICVENYLGFPLIKGEELGEKFRQHILQQKVTFLEDEVKNIRKDNDWKLKLASGKNIEAKALIYAAGTLLKKLKIPGEEEFQGKGISYCAYCDGSLYKGKEVAVIGGGDTALDDALYLSGICKEVYLIHRRKEFGGTASMASVRQRRNIKIITDARIQSISGGNKVEEITLDGDRKLSVNGVFVAIGSYPDTDLIQAYVERNSAGYVIAGEDGITKTPGLFVAGDIRQKNLRQIVTAVSDGTNAAASAMKYLDNQVCPMTFMEEK